MGWSSCVYEFSSDGQFQSAHQTGKVNIRDHGCPPTGDGDLIRGDGRRRVDYSVSVRAQRYTSRSSGACVNSWLPETTVSPPPRRPRRSKDGCATSL
jgi:hypothetical protein